jgi:hypothetical protein
MGGRATLLCKSCHAELRAWAFWQLNRSEQQMMPSGFNFERGNHGQAQDADFVANRSLSALHLAVIHRWVPNLELPYCSSGALVHPQVVFACEKCRRRWRRAYRPNPRRTGVAQWVCQKALLVPCPSRRPSTPDR